MRSVLKTVVRFAAMIAVLPIAVWFWLATAMLGRQQSFPGFSQLLSLVPGLVGVYLRFAFYRLVLPRCGDDCCISFGTVLSHPTAELGNTVYIGIGCIIGDVTLEDDVLVASQVSITNGSRQHGIDRLDVPVREQPGEWPRVTIGRDTWIGDRAVVMADVGRHCVIGAGSVVTRPIPDYAIAVGVPALVVKYRNEQPEAELVSTE